ncbi:MAG: DUF3017 domain-containing protein [Nocardioidaceae bacterium]
MNWLKRPSTTGGIVYLVCAAVVLVGLVVVAVGPWREGVTLMGLAFGLAFLMRLVLPDQLAGMLRVRHRMIDVAVLAVCAGLMLALAVVIPNRP